MALFLCTFPALRAPPVVNLVDGLPTLQVTRRAGKKKTGFFMTRRAGKIPCGLSARRVIPRHGQLAVEGVSGLYIYSVTFFAILEVITIGSVSNQLNRTFPGMMKPYATPGALGKFSIMGVQMSGLTFLGTILGCHHFGPLVCGLDD